MVSEWSDADDSDKTVCVTAVDNQQSLFAHKRADSIDSVSIQTVHITTVTSLLEREREREREWATPTLTILKP